MVVDDYACGNGDNFLTWAHDNDEGGSDDNDMMMPIPKLRVFPLSNKLQGNVTLYFLQEYHISLQN